MKLSVVLASTLLVDARKVRTPAERQSKNSDFLRKWFSHNCKGEEFRDVEIDAVRPFRCQNKFDRYMKEWEKLEEYFNKCGHFDLEAAKAAAQGRKRRDDYTLDSSDYDEDWAAFEARAMRDFLIMTFGTCPTRSWPKWTKTTKVTVVKRISTRSTISNTSRSSKRTTRTTTCHLTQQLMKTMLKLELPPI